MYKLPRQKVNLAFVLLAAGVLPVAGAPAEKAVSIPQFGFADYAWSKVSDDFQTIAGAGPGPGRSEFAFGSTDLAKACVERPGAGCR